MDWIRALQVAASITTVISLVAFAIALYLRYLTASKEGSLRQLIAGEGIVDPGAVIAILQQFADDALRLQALGKLLGYDRTLSLRVLTKVTPEISTEAILMARQKDAARRVSIAAALIFALSVVGLVSLWARSHQGFTSGAAPSSTRPMSADAALAKSDDQSATDPNGHWKRDFSGPVPPEGWCRAAVTVDNGLREQAEVWVAPANRAGDQAAWEKFPHVAKPLATIDLRPGAYAFQARRPGNNTTLVGPIVEKTLHERVEKIELQAPSAR